MDYEKLNIPPQLGGYLWFMRRKNSAYIQPHIHRELEFNLITAGQAEYIVQGQQYAIAANSLLWLFPNQPHVLINASNNFEMLIGVIQPQLIEELIQKGADKKLGVLDPGKMAPCTLTNESAQLILKQFDENKTNETSPLLYNLNLSLIYLKLWQMYETNSTTNPSKKIPAIVEKCLLKLEKQNESITLERLSAEFGYSASQLSRLFKKYTGQSIVDYRNQLRLRHVSSQLNETRTNFTTLAYEAGFGSYAQFHRIFKAEFGYSPQKAKKQKKSDKIQNKKKSH